MALIRCTIVLDDAVSPDEGDFLFDPDGAYAIMSAVGPDKQWSSILFRSGAIQTVNDPRQTLQDRWAAALGEMIQDETET
jgi:hypothetical protein